MGLIAAATDDKKVLLLDLWSGREVLAGWNVGLEGKARTWDQVVRGVAFDGERYGESGASGLVFGVGAKIERWLG